MEVRDPIHGSISIRSYERPILQHPFFQRLRKIKQLGFSEYAFPGATHTRYLHSIGTMKTAAMVFDGLADRNHLLQSSDPIEVQRLRQTLKMAALLHDIGHAPMSHSTEVVMPEVGKLGLPDSFLNPDNLSLPTSTSSGSADSIQRQATHEDYTVKAIIDSEFTESIKESQDALGIDPIRIADVIRGETQDPEYFTLKGINLFPLFSQLISGELDVDRMDYLLRDSYFCGVSYGKFDLDWMIDNLDIAIQNQTAYMAISERALSTFNDFLLSRFHMFLMVYFHYRAVCLEKMLEKYFDSPECSYSIPHSIQEYQFHDDNFLLQTLRSDNSKWGNLVLSNTVPKKVFECFGRNIEKQGPLLEEFFDLKGIDYIKCTSAGRLSKYVNHETTEIQVSPIQVIQQYGRDSNENPIVKGIAEVTDLYRNYSETHSVCRFHVFVENYPPSLVNELNFFINKKLAPFQVFEQLGQQ